MSWSNRGTTKWVMVVCALLIAVPLALVGCAKEEAPPAPPKPPAEPIVMGGSLPLTGVYAETAKWIERGYRYWAEDINAKGGLLGRPVELIIYDDASSIEKGVSYLERAITVDKVDLLLGGYPGTIAAAQMAVAEKNHMFFNSMGGHGKSWEQGYTYCTCVPPIMGEWHANGFWGVIGAMPEEDRPKTAAIINMKTGIGEACHISIVEGAKKFGVEILMDESYSIPLASADALVAKARETGADIFFANGLFPDGVLTVRAMKALDYNPKAFYQSVGCVVPAWVEELGPDGDYVFSGMNIDSSFPYPGITRLSKVVEERFQIDPKHAGYFFMGYGWCEATQKAVEGANSLEQDAIRDYMLTHEITIFDGLKYRVDERGVPPPYEYCPQVQNGVVETVYPADIATAEPIYPKPPFGN